MRNNKNDKGEYLMKKFICVSPHQPPERFSKGIYKAVDNDKLIYESETGFPVIPAINGYAEANEEIEVKL